MKKIKAILNFIWEGMKIPLLIFSLFFFGGAGLYQGVVASSTYGEMISGKALIVTLFELEKD